MTPSLIVVGAGPVGLAAAIAAARHGVPTLVLEKATLPHDKACGEGVLPNGVDALARLGLLAGGLERSSVPLKGIRYITSGGRNAAAPFPGGTGLGIRRACLSEALLARARREPGLDLWTGARADVRWDGDGPTVTVDKTTWRPRLVIGADGLQSHVRRSSGIETRHPGPRRWGVRQHFSGASWTDHVEVYFDRGFEAYVTPVVGGVNVAWLWGQEAAVQPGANVCDGLLSRTPVLADRLRGRRATDRPRAAGPFRHRPVERARDGLLLMGDAAGYLDPLTGEGVGLALLQAELFEQHVVPSLVGQGVGVLPRSTFGPYLRAIDAAAKSNQDLTRLMLSLVAHPRLVERLVGALSVDPALFQHCLHANMGRRPLWPLPVWSMLRLPLALMG